MGHDLQTGDGCIEQHGRLRDLGFRGAGPNGLPICIFIGGGMSTRTMMRQTSSRPSKGTSVATGALRGPAPGLCAPHAARFRPRSKLTPIRENSPQLVMSRSQRKLQLGGY
jgi:hypothetical protein